MQGVTIGKGGLLCAPEGLLSNAVTRRKEGDPIDFAFNPRKASRTVWRWSLGKTERLL